MNKKKLQLFKPINLVSEVKLRKKKKNTTGLFTSSNVCFLQVKAIRPRSSQMQSPPTKIANCQINSLFHLAKCISEFLSRICEDGWKYSHISHSDPQQMLDFTACKKKRFLMLAIHPQSHICPSWCRFSSWKDTGTHRFVPF